MLEKNSKISCVLSSSLWDTQVLLLGNKQTETDTVWPCSEFQSGDLGHERELDMKAKSCLMGQGKDRREKLLGFPCAKPISWEQALPPS